jgi:hypothetical protein
MGGGTKTTTNQTHSSSGNTANTYGWQTPPDTSDISAFRAYNPQMDPSIAFGAANSKNQLAQSYNNPFGSYQSAATRQAGMQSGDRSIDQNASQAMRAGAYDVSQQRGSQLAGLAGMTAPRLTQTGGSYSGTGTGSGTTQQTTSPLDSIIGGGMMAASM